jgi:hypothetical protein
LVPITPQKDGRDEIRLKYGNIVVAYLQSTLGVVLRYRELTVNERVESISPELATPGQLAWVDVVKEETGQSEVFLLGIVLGSLVGVLQCYLHSYTRKRLDLVPAARRQSSVGSPTARSAQRPNATLRI